MKMKIKLTPESARLFDMIAKSAPNWNDEICIDEFIDITSELRGNLTNLKKLKLIRTWKFDNNVWASFRLAGKELAEERGFPLPEWYHIRD